MGVRSFHGKKLAAKARELECGLNGYQARWQAYATRNPLKTKWQNMYMGRKGLLESNNRLETRFGTYLRDNRMHPCNVMMDLIMLDEMGQQIITRTTIVAPIGHFLFKRTTVGALGRGDEAYYTFSPLYNEISSVIEDIEKMTNRQNGGTLIYGNFEKAHI